MRNSQISRNFSKKLCQFANVDYDENMLNVDSWPLLINTKYNYVNISAYSKKKFLDFQKVGFQSGKKLKRMGNSIGAVFTKGLFKDVRL